jgi:hypothetical protein
MARDRAEAMKVMEGLGMIQQFAQGVGPEKAQEVIDNLDADIITRFLAMKNDLPQILFKPLQQMLQERDARAKQIKQQQMVEAASKLGPALGGMTQAAAKAKESGLLGGSEPFPFAPQDIDPAQLIEAANGIDYTEVVP